MFGLEEAVSVQLRVESCLMFCVLSVYYFSESVYVSYVKSLNESVLSFSVSVQLSVFCVSVQLRVYGRLLFCDRLVSDEKVRQIM